MPEKTNNSGNREKVFILFLKKTLQGELRKPCIHIARTDTCEKGKTRKPERVLENYQMTLQINTSIEELGERV